MPRRSPRRGITVALSLLAAAGIALGSVACGPQEPDTLEGNAAALIGSAEGTAAADAVAVDIGAGAAALGEGHMQITNLEIAGPASGVTVATPNRVGSAVVPVRRYDPADPAWAVLVWAHGGSFVRGTLDWPEADWVSRQFAAAGIRVYSVDYALASDTVKAPAPANDVAAVLEHVSAQEQLPIVIGGASAGAYLATEAALAQADLARAKHADVTGGEATDAVETAALAPARAATALILQYPTLHRVQRADAEIAAATSVLPEARQFSADRISDMYEMHLGDAADAPPVVGELAASRLALVPPTVIVNADADDLRASAEEFAEQLASAGVPVTSSVQAGTVHGYLNRPEESAQAVADATETVERFVAGIRAILAG